MAKTKLANAVPADPDHDEWQTRDDVNQLMRSDEIHADPKRLERAASRIKSTHERLMSKKSARSHGRSGHR